jgi:hypothetical protein
MLLLDAAADIEMASYKELHDLVHSDWPDNLTLVDDCTDYKNAEDGKQTGDVRTA